jgi:hypothetical protein
VGLRATSTGSHGAGECRQVAKLERDARYRGAGQSHAVSHQGKAA